MKHSKKESWWLGIIGGFFGWIAIISLVGALIFVGTYFVYGTQWWLPIVFVLLFLFLRQVMKEYYKEWQVSGGQENYPNKN
ncbi:MAG: hypothetical protein WDZ75_02235 [Candidatus Paceibacterota bacterium]